MDVDQVNELTKVGGGLLAFAAAVLGWVKVIRPRVRRWLRDFRAALDSLIGREATVDSITGQELAPALPGIGARMAHQEDQMKVLTETVVLLAANGQRIENHEHRIDALERAAVERVVGKAESVAMFSAIEAVANAGADRPPDLDEPAADLD